MVVAPPPIRTSLPCAACIASRRTSAGSPFTKWKVVSERVNDGRSWWVRTKTGVWNGGSSPHQPCQSWFCQAAVRAELVGAHDLRADVVAEVAREVVVEATAATGVGAVGPARRGACPREHGAGIGVAERPFEGLVLTRAEPVP